MAISGFLKDGMNYCNVLQMGYDSLSKGVQDALNDILEHPEKHTIGYLDAVINDPRRLSEECMDGRLWYSLTNPKQMEFLCDGEMNQSRNIHGMPPLIYALFRGFYKVALGLLKTKQFGNFATMAPVTYCIFTKRSVSDMEGSESVMHEIFGYEESRLFWQFILYPSVHTGNMKPEIRNAACAQILKAYDSFMKKSSLKDDWLDFSEEEKLIEGWTLGDKEGEIIFSDWERDRCRNEAVLNLLAYIKKTEGELFHRMINPNVFSQILLRTAFYVMMANPEEKKSDDSTLSDCAVRGLKKIYERGMEDETAFWSEYIKMGYHYAYDVNPFSFTASAEECSLRYFWNQVTGKKLYFIPDGGLIALMKEKENTVSEDPFMSYGYIAENGTVSASFLAMLIRQSDGIIYPVRPNRPVFDLEAFCKYSESNEEMILLALQKDFIRKEDLETAFRYFSQRGIRPALILKKFGEWPPIERNSDEKKVS